MTDDDIEALLKEIAEENEDPESEAFRGLTIRRINDDAFVRNSSSLDDATLAKVSRSIKEPRAADRYDRGGLRFPSRTFASLPDAGIRSFLLGCVTRHALRPLASLWANRPSLICLDLPEGCTTERASRAVRKLLAPLDQRTSGPTGPNGSGQTFAIEINKADKAKSLEAARRKQIELLMHDLRDRTALVRRIFLVVEHGAELAPEISNLCDHRVSLPTPDRRHLDAACRLLLGIVPTKAMLDDLMMVPFGEIDLILRPNTNVHQLRQILRRRAEMAARRSKRGLEISLSLDTLPGMGEATAWGQELAQDLRDWHDGLISWNDVDRGVLLHGKPGTGKTTYAKALAATCQVPLVATSVSQWQSTGHLGDLLGAMRKSFGEARDQAPCILFLDELDSLGVRSEFTGEHKTYGIQVVNGLLECLDGIEAREGVVVVGACNDTATIDPAVLRAGRLDRQIEIPLPDLDARTSILRYHLGSDAERLAPISEAPSGLSRIAERLGGVTGADIERLVRDARRTARRARRSIELDDLLALTPAPIRITDEERRRFATHEIGHALVIVSLSPDQLDSIWLLGDGKHPLGDDGAVAAARSVSPLRAVYTLGDLETELVKLMAGTVAESVLLGSRSTGASGDGNSDLARATLIAARIELHHGLGMMLAAVASENPKDIARLLQQDEELRNRVEMRLRTAYGRAEKLIRDNTEVVEQLAEELMKHGELSGDRVKEVVASARLVAI